MIPSLTMREALSGGRFWLGVITAVLWLTLLSGCATGPKADPRDPLEPINRGVFKFNDAVDTAVVRPVATAYQEVIPRPIRIGVSNFFGNLQDAWSFVNHLLQLKGQAAADSLARFGVNTFFGLGGVLDIATEMNIEKNTKDFGHTLGYWGMGAGPYLVLPLLGPSSARDAAALTVTWQGDLLNGIDHVPTRNSLTFIRAVDLRASLLQATKMLEEAALDKYSFTRDAYLQSRRSAIYDGNPPEESSQNTLVKPDVAQFETPVLTQINAETLSSSGIAGEEKAQP